MIVVDDAPDLREMLAEYLARHGFSVADAVAAARDVAGYALRSSGVTVLTALDDAPLVMADPDQLVQILVNLLVNAEQAMRGQAARRQATNAASVSDGMVHCDLGDTGPGVPPALAERIFEPSFTTKPVGLGTGVGLSVSAGTARPGGRARAAAGKAGAVVRLSLPAAAVPGHRPDAVPEPPVAGRRLRLLIVDDEQEVAAMVADLATRAGHAASVAKDGYAALARLETEQVDAVLCDVRMPILDGPGFRDRLAAMRPDLAARFVFMTGDMTDPRLADSPAAVLEKPVAPEGLRAVLRARGRGRAVTRAVTDVTIFSHR